MKHCRARQLRANFLLAVVLFIGNLTLPLAASTNVYSTQFEVAQGYNAANDLAGQNGWVIQGSGGNGLVTNFIAGQGQQAYIGFDPPNAGGVDTLVWRPINYSPLAAGKPIVKFSTLMSIRDSTNGEFDFFQWSVFNIAGARLFTLDFDNYYTNINYVLDGTNTYVGTGVKYTPGSNYTLTITMNFASNRWSATLGSALLVTNKLMTTVGAQLTLGDVDAVWSLYATNAPGNNYMVFDNYTITADALTPSAPQLRLLGRTPDGQTSLRLTGETNTRFAIEATTNLLNWTSLKTNLLADGSFDYVDTGSGTFNRRFYRARWVP